MRDVALISAVGVLVVSFVGFVIPQRINRGRMIQIGLWIFSSALLALNIGLWRSTGLDILQYMTCMINETPKVCEPLKEARLADIHARNPELPTMDEFNATFDNSDARRLLEAASAEEDPVDGQTLQAMHIRLNGASILKSANPVGAHDRLSTPVFRDYCRLDGILGIRALRVESFLGRTRLTLQSTAHSRAARAARGDRAMSNVDFMTAHMRTGATPVCTSRSCNLRLDDGGRANFTWTNTPAEIQFTMPGEGTTTWSDCRCTTEGSGLFCRGID